VGERKRAVNCSLRQKKNRQESIFFAGKRGKLSYREAENLLHALRDNAKLVEWHVKGGSKREYYGIIAESIEGKEELRNQGFMVYDLEERKALPFILFRQ
jgi:AAA+ ATPase superfamily predicted ATPase